MKRLLTVAVLVVGSGLFASSSEANDRFHGGHGHHAHHGGYGGYSYGHSRQYSNYGHAGYYGGHSYNFGNGYGYHPRFQGGYAPNYRSYGYRQHQHHGGLHIDAGRFHLGIGGHHH